MKTSKRKGLAFVIATAVSAWGVSNANASEVYTYTGNDFTGVSGSYSTLDSVSISITLSTPLGDDFSGSVTPTSFTASDGVQTITSANASLSSSAFYFVTNGSGQITGWVVEVFTNPYVYSVSGGAIGTQGAGQYTYQPPPDAIVGSGSTNEDDGALWGSVATSGYIDGDPGTWSATPLPAALPLFATGLGVMSFVVRRKRRKNVAAIATA